MKGGAGGATPNIDGGYSVYEGYGELIAPIVEDKEFFESLTGDHDLAEAMALDTLLPITDGARQILRAISGNPRER